MVLLQINFDFPVKLMGSELVENASPLAMSINGEKGFISKIWIENSATGRSGGIYIFDTMENAEAYSAMHCPRVANIGAKNIDCQYFEVNGPLSLLNHGIQVNSR